MLAGRGSLSFKLISQTAIGKSRFCRMRLLAGMNSMHVPYPGGRSLQAIHRAVKTIGSMRDLTVSIGQLHQCRNCLRNPQVREPARIIIRNRMLAHHTSTICDVHSTYRRVALKRCDAFHGGIVSTAALPAFRHVSCRAPPRARLLRPCYPENTFISNTLSHQ